MKPTIFVSIGHITQLSAQDHWEDEYIAGFKTAERKKESILARKLLNELCLFHFAKTVKDLDFRKTDKGKPILNLGHCSISHSGGVVAVGVSKLNFGIDIENMNQPNCEQLEIAFSKEEWLNFKGNSADIIKAFSMKEAITKKTGTGFLINPDSINIKQEKHFIQRVLSFSSEREFVLSICSEENFTTEINTSEMLCQC